MGGVVVHAVDLDAMAEPDATVLAEDERARAARMTAPGLGRRFIACRAALRRLLANASGVPPRGVRIIADPSGKPRWHGSDWEFSVTHAGPRALIAIARGMPVGIDLESVDRVAEHVAIAERWFHPAMAGLVRSAGAEVPLVFARLWTLAEALAKVDGRGLAGILGEQAVDVSPALAGPIRVEGGTMLGRLAVDDGWVAALAVRGDIWPTEAVRSYPTG